ncbi:MAG: copper chaperone Copz family protein [Cyanobacteria bacterium J069]
MTDCDCPPASNQKNEFLWQHLCPQDGTKGKPVKLITLKSLLVPRALEQLDATLSYEFCANESCPVVYFSEQGKVFMTSDLKVPVFQKEVDEAVLVCYCFGWSRQRIRETLEQSGKNSDVMDVVDIIVDKGVDTVVDTIKAHIQAKRCGCEVNNPQGACCLGNIRLVAAQMLAK